MAKVSLNTIKNWFRTGLVPSQAQFWDTWDSFFHKDDTIPVAQIGGITELLNEVNATLAKANTALQPNDISTSLSETTPGKVADATAVKLLKDYIDAINVLLTSDDTTLDELQEIVTFIKQNKTELDTLGISNIAGLQSALTTLQNNIDAVGTGGSPYLQQVENDYYLEEYFVSPNVNKYKFDFTFNNALFSTFPSTTRYFNSISSYYVQPNSQASVSSYSVYHMYTAINTNVINTLYGAFESYNPFDFYIFGRVTFVVGSPAILGKTTFNSATATTGSGIYLHFDGDKTISFCKRLNNVTTIISSATLYKEEEYIPYDLDIQIMVYNNEASVKVKDPNGVVVQLTGNFLLGSFNFNSNTYLGVSFTRTDLNSPSILGIVHQLIVGGKRPAKLIHF